MASKKKDEGSGTQTVFLKRAFAVGDGPLYGPGECEVPDNVAYVASLSPDLVDPVAEAQRRRDALSTEGKAVGEAHQAMRETALDAEITRATDMDPHQKDVTPMQAHGDTMLDQSRAAMGHQPVAESTSTSKDTSKSASRKSGSRRG